MSKHETEEDLWRYNAEDCCRTFEIAEVERSIVSSFKLETVERFQQDLLYPVLQAMQRGVCIDLDARAAMAKELRAAIKERDQWITDVLGHPLNPRSPKQMQALFYEDLKQPIIWKRHPGKPSTPTLDDEAMSKLAAKEPLLRPIFKRIAELRSLGVFLSTFVEAQLDHDNRMRCSYNVCGTTTYRLSSSENAFESGTNLQNIPKGSKATEPEELSLPNIRKIFVPDAGYTFFDMDLDRADLQVVVWEADDLELKQMLREGVDIHQANSATLGISRQLAKSWVHGTNYGGSPRTMATNCGLTIRQAEDMQKRWFAAHPGIEKWHRRVEVQLKTKRMVENKLGYRFFFFGRTEELLPEALAWIPQSTVACVINRVWKNIYDQLPEIQVLLQVHDSLAGQIPTARLDELKSKMIAVSRITIPYDDPLIIPVGVKTSPISWGDCA